MQQRIGLAVVGALVIAACSSSTDPLSARRGSKTDEADPTGGATNPAATGPLCPADVAAPTSVATDGDATDLRIAGANLYFRVGTKLVQIGKDGSNRKEVYTSDDLIRSYTDGKTIVAVESPNPPNALFRVSEVGGDPGQAAQVDTDLVAAGMTVFGADDANVYAIGETATGDTFYKLARENAGGLDTVFESKGVVTDPQIVGGTFWYVKDNKDIYKRAGDAEPTLVATVDAGCSLVVTAAALYCTTAGSLEQRDLAGANPKKLFDATTSKTPVPFGTSTPAGEGVVVRAAGENALKAVLRSVVGGTEKVIACGRDPIGAMVSDGTTVAWIEPGKGIFTAPVR